MKYFGFFLFILFMLSCKGSKNVVTNEQPKTEIKTLTDSLRPAPKDVKIAVDSLYLPEVKEKVETTEEAQKGPKSPHVLWGELLYKYVSQEGNVDYPSFKKERGKLVNYINTLDSLKADKEFEYISREEKLVYWINAYNALTIDLILRHYPLKSIKDIKDPWDLRYWKLGDKWYNLNEIEHQILRKMDEPRIHFAIVCASYSCPKLQNYAFTAINLEAQLTTATKEFLNDAARNSIAENSLELSKIFKWFSKDFKQDGSLIDFLNQYSNIRISDNARIRYKPYNWDLND